MKRSFFILLLFIGIFTGQFFTLRYQEDTKVARFQRRTSPFSGEVQLPPQHLVSYLTGTLLGGGKQLALDYLWVRYHRLKQQDRYQESIQLLELIAHFQPHRISGWKFLGWDLAYNVSKRRKNKEEQWSIIKKAIRFLQKGKALNPDSSKLLLSFARIYHHRIPQDPFFMKAVEQKYGDSTTTYRKAVKILQEGREKAKKKGGDIDFYRTRYGFLVSSMFYDVMRLVHKGKYDRARKRIHVYRRRTDGIIRELQDAGRYVPRPYTQRLQSYDDLSGILDLDEKAHQIAMDQAHRSEKVKTVFRLMKQYGRLFKTYPLALSKEGIRHVVQVLFELLYYADQDLRAFHRTGNRKYRRRAQELWKNVREHLSNLVETKKGTGLGLIQQARTDLGMYWNQLNNLYSSIKRYQQFRRKFNKENLSEKEQEQFEEIEQSLERIYVKLVRLKQSQHRGFRQSFLASHIQTLENILRLRE